MIYEKEITEIQSGIDSHLPPDGKETLLQKQCAEKRIPLNLVRHSKEVQKFNGSYFMETVLTLCEDHTVYNLFEQNLEQFEMCPASTKYHGAYFGGLRDHKLTVCECIHDLLERFPNVSRESAYKVALLHDVGKMGTIDIPMYVVNPDFTKHNKEPFIWNEELPQMPHEIYSLYLIHRYKIMLSAEEWQAVAYHNGYYVEGAMQALRGKECPLTLLLHTADNFASKLRDC